MKTIISNVYDANCPTRKVLDLIANKWATLIIGLLNKEQPQRFAALQRQIGGISQKMLTQTLRSLERDELVRRLEQTLQRKVWMAAAGPAEIHCVGIVTGGAGAEVAKAAAEGVDTFVTGEGPHHTFGLAEELGLNLIYGGHYATETFGVCALGEMLSQKLGVPWVFLDHPSGL